MILFFIAESSIILAGLLILLGYTGAASKFLAGTFFIIFFAVMVYLIQLTGNVKK